MNVKLKKDNTILFRDLFIGECFMYHGYLCIKVNISQQELNAFNCNENELCTIDGDFLVERRAIELVEV